jgi:hypothetical protein
MGGLGTAFVIVGGCMCECLVCVCVCMRAKSGVCFFVIVLPG